MEARAYWTVSPGRGEIRTETLAGPGPGEALVRTTRSGISRGTEHLVHTGAVPESVRELMRAPYQVGDLPGPVKYGYLAVGVVEATGPDAAGDRGALDDPGDPDSPDTPDDLVGRRVFCLHPHQDRFVVPASSLVPIPDDVPDDRAVLAGAVETAINAVWDAAPRYGDRIAVVGAGMIGASVASLLRRFPLDRLELVDPDPARAALGDAFGVEVVHPDDARGECDLVVHASATEAGLARGLDLLGDEGELIEMSWYGERSPAVPLGGAFHARRLSIRASQVGAVSPSRRARRSTTDRLALALATLADPAYDALLTGPCSFADLPQVMDAVATGREPALCHVVTYD